MADLTDNYNFLLPEVGADDDLWGGFLNTNWTSLDTQLKALADAVTELTNRALIPIGGLYTTTVATDPATVLGYGTWEAYAKGRALVGVGDNGTYDWTGEEERGSETHTLTVDELAAHGHSNTPGAISVSSTTDLIPVLSGITGVLGAGSTDPAKIAVGSEGIFGDAGVNLGRYSLSFNFNHSHTASMAPFSSNNTGDGNPHNNVQPSIGVYIWRRTA